MAGTPTLRQMDHPELQTFACKKLRTLRLGDASESAVLDTSPRPTPLLGPLTGSGVAMAAEAMLFKAGQKLCSLTPPSNKVPPDLTPQGRALCQGHYPCERSTCSLFSPYWGPVQRQRHKLIGIAAKGSAIGRLSGCKGGAVQLEGRAEKSATLAVNQALRASSGRIRP